MASLKVIRKRISSVKSTQQITKAMKMVAAAKLRRAQEAATEARPYAEKLGDLLRKVAEQVDATSHPLLAQRTDVKYVDLILVTSDRGLCGAYNSALIRRAEAFLSESHDKQVRLTAIGRKGYDYFRKRPVQLREHFINLSRGPDRDLAERLSARVAQEFASGQTDAVYVIYSHFQSALSLVPTLDRLLPVPTADAESPLNPADYIYEPDSHTLLDRLLRRYVTSLIQHAFLEAIASEHGARMTAMDSATSNASDMIGRLTLEMNRARQAAITKELMEIVSGAEALKG
jgi:F-type H+-transporting ATPase subunit gamma